MNDVIDGLALSGEGLQRHLPHRGAMLFARSVCVCAPDRFEGTACWPSGSPVLDGHFPGRPLVPGVLLVEGAAQVAGAALNAVDAARSGRLRVDGVLAMVRRCVFRAAVAPAETVAYRLHVEHQTGSLVAVAGTASVDGRVVAELAFALARVEEDRP